MSLSKKILGLILVLLTSCFLSLIALADPLVQGWQKDERGWWYVQVDGSYPSDSWKNLDNKWYYFDDNGYMVEDSWVDNYYVGSDGAMLVSSRTPDGQYVRENGERIEESKSANQKSIVSNIQKPADDEDELKNLVGPGVETDNTESTQAQTPDTSSIDNNDSNNGPVAATENNIGPVADTDKVLENISPDSDNQSGKQPENNEQNTSTQSNQVVPAGGIVTDPMTTVISNDNTGEQDERTKVVNELKKLSLSDEEANLYYLINEYRESLGLSKLSFSKSLTTVARAHVKDSHDYTPRLQLDERGIQGNLHSWSHFGNWSGGAYTPDHAHAEIMWDKPSELTDYKGSGYEISVYHSIGIDPQLALDLWKSSPGHNAVIIGEGEWSFIKTVGVAMDKNYSHVWFGGDKDPAGYYDVEGYEVVHP